MMDIKDIIKWFLPGSYCIRYNIPKRDVYLTLLCLFLFSCPIYAAKLPSDIRELKINSDNNVTKNININSRMVRAHEIFSKNISASRIREGTNDIATTSIGDGRTFGRPLKKMMQAMVPLIFHLGAAATWAVVSALVGMKTFAVTLIILKLLLIAGAAKFGALFAQKLHHSPPAKWEPTKEIHLHIHNNGHEVEHAPPGTWSREGQPGVDEKPIIYPGPQTISTPYGNYVRMDSVVQTPPGHLQRRYSLIPPAVSI